jgi:hypothetical protein
MPLFRKADLTYAVQAELHYRKAREYWSEDRLELAQAAMDAALRAGLPASDIYDFQRTVEAECAARRAARIVRIGEHAALEAEPVSYDDLWRTLVVLTRRAVVEVSSVLGVAWGKPVLVTMFQDDEWVEFMHARYGYYAERAPWHKVCLPPSAAASPPQLLRALRHEVAHAAVRTLAGGAAPRWLDEGTAVWMEGGATPDERRRLRIAVRRGHRPSLARISGAFESFDVPIDSLEGLMGYAGAGAFVSAAIERSGVAALRALLVGLGAGQSVDSAHRRAFGIPLRAAERAWVDALTGAAG